MGMIRLDVTESYYGDGFKRRDGKLEILVLVDPSYWVRRSRGKPPIHKLVLDVQLPVLWSDAGHDRDLSHGG